MWLYPFIIGMLTGLITSAASFIYMVGALLHKVF